MKLPRVLGWGDRIRRKASLQQRMTMMLLVIVLQSILISGGIVIISSVYLQNVNAVLNACYEINGLLGVYTAEADALRTYVLYGDETALSDYGHSREVSDQVIEQVDITFDASHDQYLLLQAVKTTYGSFRQACDRTVDARMAGEEYAEAYDAALSRGQYIDGYIKDLLQIAIDQGQAAYQRNMAQFRLFPALFVFSVVLSFVCIGIWTRWTVRHVVTPINRLIKVAGAMSENQYDAPDIMVYADDEISQLSRVINEMKRSTAQLVDSLRVQREIESKLHTEEVRRMRMETTMDTLRLSLLQSQINPHFLFNTLNIISRMAQMEAAPKTEELIVRLANLFRYNLQSVDKVVPLTDELKIVGDYIAIQRIRFGERILFELVCEVEPAQVTIPVFTLQPLIENAVIHGIGPMEEGGTVTVEIRSVEGALVIAVRDTGVGISQEKQALLLSDAPLEGRHVSGLGLGNVRDRIAAHYPGSSFTVESRLGEGTSIVIIIPPSEEEPASV